MPFFVLTPWAIAGDDGSNAFAYRLPAPAIGILAAASAVLVLTGVLIRTGRWRPPQWVGAAFLLIGAVPLLWAGYRQLRPLDETGQLPAGAEFRGARLGDSRARVIEALGEPSGKGSSIAPLGEDFEEIGGPPFIETPGSTHETLRYRNASVLLSDGRVYGFAITDEDAETSEGVGVGDNLGVAENEYQTLNCGTARADDYRTFPYCGGRLGRQRWMWFGQDPIRSIVVTATELGRD